MKLRIVRIVDDCSVCDFSNDGINAYLYHETLGIARITR